MSHAGRLLSVDVNKVVSRDDVKNRDLDDVAVKELMSSIVASGLNTPIRVRPIKVYNSGVCSDAWELIAGQHRLEAVRRLGWSHIDASADDVDDLTAELAMLDENLVRADLGDAYRLYAIDRRKFIYEVKFPETALGGVGRGQTKVRQNGEPSDVIPDRFTLSTAKLTGRSERSVQRDAQIGKALKEDALKVVGTSLDKQSELAALAKLPEPERKSLIERAATGEKVSARAAPIKPLPLPPHPDDAPADNIQEMREMLAKIRKFPLADRRYMHEEIGATLSDA